jgi:hypothetical protein
MTMLSEGGVARRTKEQERQPPWSPRIGWCSHAIETSPWYRRSLVHVELVSEDRTYDRIDQPSVVYP